MTVKKRQSVSSIITLVMAILILIPSMLGFANKLIEFVITFRSAPEGVFAVTPIINYVLTSLGFLMLLFWAIANGMFRDIEEPKHAMLEQERKLDRT